MSSGTFDLSAVGATTACTITGATTLAGSLTIASSGGGTGSLSVQGTFSVSQTSTFTGAITINSSSGITQALSVAGALSSITTQNTSTSASAFTYSSLNNNGGTGLYLAINSSARTTDGGANGAVIRNDAGQLTLSSSGSTASINLSGSTVAVTGITILNSTLDVQGVTSIYPSGTASGQVLLILKPALASGNEFYTYIGRATSTDESLVISYKHNTTVTSRSVSFGWAGSPDILQLTRLNNSVTIPQNLTVSGTTTTSSITFTTGSAANKTISSDANFGLIFFGNTGVVGSHTFCSSAGTNYLALNYSGYTAQVLGTLSVTGATTLSGILTINNSLRVFNPTLTTTNRHEFFLGRDLSSYNSVIIDFNYNAANSTTNTLGFGFYNANNLVTIDGTGRLAVSGTCNRIQSGTTASASSGTVTFATAFGSTPNVTISPKVTVSGVVATQVTAVSTTQFSWQCYQATGSGTFEVTALASCAQCWIASDW
jgi:hypothetical protein